jgi:hypothetical protein
MIFFSSVSVYCNNEPENHLGWTLSELKGKFPTLIKIQEKDNTVAYALGESGEEGISWYYILKDNIVFTEIWNVRSKDTHARDFFEQMTGLLALSCPDNLVEKGINEVHFKFSTFTLDYSYETETSGIKKTLAVYKMFLQSQNSDKQIDSDFIRRSYKWNSYRTVDNNYNVSKLYSQRGSKVTFYTHDSKEYIKITGYDGGDDVWYNGKVIDKKPKSVNGNEECYVYLFINESGVWKSFVQLFEIYDVTKSKSIPIRFLVHQTDQNGNFQTGRILEDISR